MRRWPFGGLVAVAVGLMGVSIVKAVREGQARGLDAVQLAEIAYENQRRECEGARAGLRRSTTGCPIAVGKTWVTLG